MHARYLRTAVTYGYVVTVLCLYANVRVSVYWKGMYSCKTMRIPFLHC
jgi:hypothetical protein